MLNDFRFECIGEVETDDEMLIGECSIHIISIDVFVGFTEVFLVDLVNFNLKLRLVQANRNNKSKNNTLRDTLIQLNE